MSQTGKTIYIHSLGCKVNSYESFAVGEAFRENGFRIVHKPDGADVLLLNSCSVTSRADQKSRQLASRLRKASLNGVLVVMGCSSQTHKDDMLRIGADIVLGTAKRDVVLQTVLAFKRGQQLDLVNKTVRPLLYEELGCHSYFENSRAYLKIQDGCDNFCSYCLIPYIRGNSRSRGIEETLREAHDLVDRGYKEIIISGIHIGAYGKDLGDGSYQLCDLLHDMQTQNPTLKRIRISSIEETELDERFLEELNSSKAIVDHMHIPLQSGSKGVLARMHRKYDTDAFLRKLDFLRAIRPDMAITTDVIVGFPGETDEEWRETVEFCKKAAFAEIHVFPFSARPGTVAFTMKDTDAKVKKERVDELLALSKELRSSYESRFKGKTMEVLFEDYDKASGKAFGHTSNYLLVGVPSDCPLHGELRNVIYDDATSSD